MGRPKKNPDITKEEFLAELAKQNGNCYRAYTNLGLPYLRYYQWRKEDPEFNKEVENLQNCMIHVVEDRMFELIKEGNAGLVKFYLSAKGGYTEKRQIDVNTTNVVDVNQTINDIRNELENE